jgi:hypothetical protein
MVNHYYETKGKHNVNEVVLSCHEVMSIYGDQTEVLVPNNKPKSVLPKCLNCIVKQRENKTALEMLQ